MKTTSLSATSALLLALLTAIVPAGTGCVGDVDSELDEEGSDQNELAAEDPCEPGQTQECTIDDELTGFQTCVEIDGETAWSECEMSASSTPLVLSFENRPVEMVTSMAGAFDLTGLGATIATDWPTAATPWLALDRDGDGAIGGGEELFGSATVLADGTRARNGFDALRELDSDGDERITAADQAWPRLVLWADADADRASAPGELAPLASRGIVAIELSYTRDPRCDARKNCEIERAAFSFSDGTATRTGAIVDVHLRWQ